MGDFYKLYQHTFSAYDLYDTFNKKQLKIRQDVIEKKYGHNKRQKFCKAVLIYCMYLIILDIIENNVTFVLPLYNNKNGFIYVRPVVGEEFKTARKAGAFEGIDFMVTGGKGYVLTFQYDNSSGIHYKPIYMNKRFKDVLYKYINEGKEYY